MNIKKRVAKNYKEGVKAYKGWKKSRKQAKESGKKIAKGLLKHEFTPEEQLQFGIKWNRAEERAEKAVKKDPAKLTHVKKYVKSQREKFNRQVEEEKKKKQAKRKLSKGTKKSSMSSWY